MFFGALLSAIKSCASARCWRLRSTFTENILSPMFGHMSDRKLLRLMRIVVLCFTVLVTLFALNSQRSIYKMVENAYKVTLVAAFVPLVFGLYWRRATNQGALCCHACGLITWLAAGDLQRPAGWPPQLAGLLTSFGRDGDRFAAAAVDGARRRPPEAAPLPAGRLAMPGKLL